MNLKEKITKQKQKKEELTPAQKRRRKKKIIRWSIFGVIVLILFIYYLANVGRTPSTENSTMSKVSKETIATSIGATGMIESSDSKIVTTKLSGLIVKNVFVDNGDVVNCGDPICEFDVSDASKALAEQRKNEREAEQERNNAKQEAQDQLDVARENLETAQARRDNAQQKLEEYSNNMTNSVVSNTIISNTIQNITNSISNTVVSNTTNTANTINTTNTTNTSTDARKIAEYERELNQANADVARYQSAVDTLEQQIRVLDSNAASNITDLLGGYGSSSSMSMGGGLLSGLGFASLSNEEIIANKVVTAPASGTITNLSVVEDAQFSGSQVCLIEGADTLCVTCEIGEYDIPDIKTGMKVKIKTEATRNQELDGIITSVASTPTTTGLNSLSNLMSSSLMSGMMSGTTSSSSSSSTGGVSYTVKIDILNQNDRLRLGMNAKLSIITDMRENVLSVPYDAINTRDDGTKYITVVADDFDLDKIAKEQKKDRMLEATREIEKDAIPNELLEGQTKEITVETGLEGTYNVEIKSSEIYENMKIIVNKSNVTNSIEALLELMGAGAGT